MLILLQFVWLPTRLFVCVMNMAQVGLELERNFDGKASNLVDSCGKSAVELVTLVTRHFPGIFDFLRMHLNFL